MRNAFCLAVVLLAFVVPSRVAASEESSKGDCYPGNGVLIAPGPTWARGEASGRVATVETADSLAVDTDRGPARIEIEFVANITGPNTTGNNGVSTGRANVKIHWLDSTKTGGITETSFDSGCVAEIETDKQVDLKIGEFEGEFEGAVKNFPGYPGTKKAAVLSMVVHEDGDHAGRVAVDFSIELGYTCFENVYTGGNDIETEKITLANLEPDEFKIKNDGNHGLYSHPDQHDCGY